MPKVTMPQLGESVAEGTIGKWLKQVGEPVAKYEPLVEVVTDKVNAEVPSPFEGTLTQILVEEGQTVPNNAEIAVIEAAGEASATDDSMSSAPTASAEPDGPQVGPSAEAAEEPASDAARSQERVFASGPQASGNGASAERTVLGTGAGPAGSDERLPEEMGRRASAAAASAPSAERPGSAGSGSRPESGAPAPSSGVKVGAAAPQAPAGSQDGSAGNGSVRATPTTRYEGPVTPAVRRLAREHSLDLSLISGTGHDGRITRDDVMRFVQSGGAAAAERAQPASPQVETSTLAQGAAPAAAHGPSAPSAPPAATVAASGQDELKAQTPMRRAIAAQMVRSKQTAPHAYTTVEVDMSGVVGLRESMKDVYSAREGANLSYVAIVAKAVVEGLRKHPDLNAHWTDEGVLRRSAINLGIAVAVDDGLIVPVVKNADQFSVHGLNLWVQDFATRARGNRLRLDDIQGGTFTLNNTGWFGSVASQPIINVPEVAILSMEAIVKKPVVIEAPGGDTIGIRPMMNICLSFDHRATDGAQVGRFVQDVRRWLESAGPDTPIW